MPQQPLLSKCGEPGLAVPIVTDVIEALWQKCLRCVATRISLYEDELLSLPPNIKERLLKILCQRGRVTNKLLASLVNNRTKSLSLSACPIDDDGIKALASCDSLRRLDLNSDPKGYVHRVTSLGVVSVALSCKYLQHVGLRRCMAVGDTALVALANGCPLLRRLNVSGLNLISDAALDALGSRCSHIESIDFSCTNVTDSGVLSLANGASRGVLREILMARCLNLTDNAVECVISLCPIIDILVFHSCPLISDRSREALEELMQMRAGALEESQGFHSGSPLTGGGFHPRLHLQPPLQQPLRSPIPNNTHSIPNSNNTLPSRSPKLKQVTWTIY